VPYNAHATASDALWAGLPVLTCRRRAFAGRVAAGMLESAGLSELVTESLQEYEARATELARAPERLASLKAKLVQAKSSQLFDTAHYARNLEQAFHAMWERSQSGEPRARFTVPG
jgi:predicted O-linked N-acetylglucosamine transferase (SPINDLY family)